MNRDYGVTGDPIHVGVFSRNPETWTDVKFDPCDIESAEQQVFQGAETFPSALQASTFARVQFERRHCFNRAVDVTISGKGPNGAASRTQRIGQAQRYRATVQLGGLFTDNHDGNFGLRRDLQDSTRIYNKGPTGTGTEYFASIVFYSALQYLPTLFGGEPYPGRDIIHENGFLDRIGLLLGVGLKEPARRFVVGGTFELIPGVNGFAGWDFARIRDLAGYELGDVFRGDESTIPTTENWERKFVGGISLDLLYATKLFKR